MIIKEQKEITLDNKCNALLNEEDLKSAILWYAKPRAVSKIKTVYLHGKYPAVSIYFEKIHIHRLLMMFWLQEDLDSELYVHHKDGNKLNALKDNLEIVKNNIHQSFHNKGKTLTKEHKLKISESNKKRKGMKIKKQIEMPELKELLEKKWSINKIAKFYGCDWSTVKNRIYENPELLGEKKNE